MHPTYTILDGVEVALSTAAFPSDTFQGTPNLASTWLQVDACCASSGLIETLQVFVADGEGYCGDGHMTQFTPGAVKTLIAAAKAAL